MEDMHYQKILTKKVEDKDTGNWVSRGKSRKKTKRSSSVKVQEKSMLWAAQQNQRVAAQTGARWYGFQKGFLGEKNRIYKLSEGLDFYNILLRDIWQKCWRVWKNLDFQKKLSKWKTNIQLRATKSKKGTAITLQYLA